MNLSELRDYIYRCTPLSDILSGLVGTYDYVLNDNRADQVLTGNQILPTSTVMKHTITLRMV